MFSWIAILIFQTIFDQRPKELGIISFAPYSANLIPSSRVTKSDAGLMQGAHRQAEQRISVLRDAVNPKAFAGRNIRSTFFDVEASCFLQNEEFAAAKPWSGMPLVDPAARYHR